MAQPVFQSSSSKMDLCKTSAMASDMFGSQLRSPEIERTRFRFMDSFRRNPNVRLNAIMESSGVAQEIIENKPKVAGATKTDEVSDYFKELRHRFLGFKKDKYLSNIEHYQRLAEVQEPKFMVIACADSRVCPSSVLGFQPGEAFVIRNVANLVPPHENGPTETNAALEFAVTSLEVENILVVGHSCCGGIKALMSLDDEVNSSSFIRSWVVVGKPARSKTETAASNLNFDQQCRHCEKVLDEFTHLSMDRGAGENGTLSIHGGYYDFIDCTFEKWTLDYKGRSITNREFWS